ncbi:MAG TPA: rRNA maturation RNase YbeY [Flavobacteriaceae bacterium]|nr:rRNA maturation RNase YbeY [Flavobacteriaceae bacterium]
MIEFSFQKELDLQKQYNISSWISTAIINESYNEGDINYVFCSDEYLLEININHLNHNTLTDIITFNYNLGKQINTEIYISIDRVKENAESFNNTFTDELHRVIIHGILHLCGYKDKTQEEKSLMREKEDYYLSLRNF